MADAAPTAPHLEFGLAGLTAQDPTAERFGANTALRTTLRAARTADEHGFDAVWTSEHHGSPDGFMPAPMVLLSAISQVTARVRLGTNVVVAPVWDPIRLAEEVAVVDQLSDGRVSLGLGIGYMEHEFRALGAAYTERARVLETTVGLLRSAWAGEPLGGLGTMTSDESIQVTPRPLQEPGPPILLGGFVRTAVRRARRLGQGYLGPTVDPAGLDERIGWLLEDGPLPGFSVSATAFAFVSADGHAPPPPPGPRSTGGHNFAAPRPEGAGSAVNAVGNPDQVVQILAPFAERLGALPGDMTGHLCMCLLQATASERENLESVRLFGDEVIPALREIAAFRSCARPAGNTAP